jgi:biofilm protein TabA
MKSTLLPMVALLILVSACAGRKNLTGEQRDAMKWYREGSWKKGLGIPLHSSVNVVEFRRQYLANPAVWDKAFAFLRDSARSGIAPGRHAVAGTDAYANVQLAKTRERSDANWESHRNYIDLQYVLEGKETFGLTDSANATVKSPYNPKSDGASYTSEKGKYYVGDKGVFFLFFPADIHRPLIRTDGIDSIKKVVIKIRAVR